MLTFDLHRNLLDKSDPKARLFSEAHEEYWAVRFEFKNVFQAEIPFGRHSPCDVDHVIEPVPDTKPPHRPPYQHSSPNWVQLESMSTSFSSHTGTVPVGHLVEVLSFLGRSLVAIQVEWYIGASKMLV